MTTTDPTVRPLDLDAIKAAWLSQCGCCDAGLPVACTCTGEDQRPVMLALVREVERLRAEQSTAGFSANPAALAWARAAVERDVERLCDWERTAVKRGDTERAAALHRMVSHLERRYIGGEGCTIAAFDERRPGLAALLAQSVPATAGGDR